jgi:transposase
MRQLARGARHAISAFREASEDGPLRREEHALSETRKYRKFTAQQKTEIVLASLRGRRRWPSCAASTTSPTACCASGASSSSPPGASGCQGKAERTEADELRRQVGRRLERALGDKTMEVGDLAGELLRGWE